jgi:hypothetical protein
MILIDFLESRETINFYCYIMMTTKLKAQIFRVRSVKKTFTCYTIMPSPIPV